MARVRALAGGGREVEVEPARLERFCVGVVERHGPVVRTRTEPDRVVLTTADDTVVELLPTVAGLVPATADAIELGPLREHLDRPWRVGLLLVRAGGHSAGVAVDGLVIRSSTDRRHVQGRSAAGGWSQQRFARRRAGQTRAALQQAADTVARALLGQRLDVLVTGGDRGSVSTVLDDPRLAPLRALVSERWLDVAEPRRAVLDEAALRAHAVLARIRD